MEYMFMISQVPILIKGLGGWIRTRIDCVLIHDAIFTYVTLIIAPAQTGTITVNLLKSWIILSRLIYTTSTHTKISEKTFHLEKPSWVILEISASNKLQYLMLFTPYDFFLDSMISQALDASAWSTSTSTATSSL